jgi:hypothetical protein
VEEVVVDYYYYYYFVEHVFLIEQEVENDLHSNLKTKTKEIK